MNRGTLLKGTLCALACLAVTSFAAHAESYKEHVVIILDGSGSMNDPMQGSVIKMDAAKRALKQVLKQVDPSTEVGMLVFSDHQHGTPWVYPLGELQLENLNAAIDEVQAGGGTPLGKFIKTGADALLETRKDDFGYGTYRLLIVTDGEATDMDDMVRYAREVPTRGITMDVIGVKMDQAPALAELAHSYREASDPESLARAIESVFAEVGSGGSGDTTASDFELLEALPFEAAEAMLAGLAKTSDEPLRGIAGAKTTATRGQTSNQSPSAPQPVQPAPSGKSSPFGAAPVIIVVVIAIILAGRSKKRRRRW